MAKQANSGSLPAEYPEEIESYWQRALRVMRIILSTLQCQPRLQPAPIPEVSAAFVEIVSQGDQATNWQPVRVR